MLHIKTVLGELVLNVMNNARFREESLAGYQFMTTGIILFFLGLTKHTDKTFFFFNLI